MVRSIELRVFVSSTFGDMVAERSMLQNEVFPRVDAYCRARGAAFRAIDLRWGISAAAARDRRTMEICLAEVRRCRRASPLLNFIGLIGSRYGWRPLPSEIDANDFEALRADALASDRRRLARAYRRDDNAVPARWVLRAQAARAGAAALLADEQAVRAALDRMLEHAWPDADRRRLRYGASATHLEIAERFALDAGGTVAKGSALFYVREAHRPGEIAPADRAGLAALQADVQAKVGARALFRYEAADLQTWRERIERDLIRRARAALGPALTPSDPDQRYAQQTFAQGLAAGARGHEALLARVRRRPDAVPGDPIVVTGVSGSGKSTLLARAWSAAAAEPTAPETLLLARFVGSTSESRHLEGLLTGLCAEIDRADARDETLPTGVDALAKALRERLCARPERPVIMIVDALDQLDCRSARERIAWLPRELPAHVQVLASALEDAGAAGDTLRALRALLPRAAFVPMRPLGRRDTRALLRTWLAAAGRKLQPPQAEAVLAAAASCPTPLYLRLATIEAAAWRSFDDAEPLPASTETLLARRFEQLAMPVQHGATMVRSSLALLGAARHGLSESEMLSLLSGDPDVMAELARRSPHWPLNGQLPFVVWARLRADLAPYLIERADDATELMAPFHGAVQRAAENFTAVRGALARAHANLARFFAGKFAAVPQPHLFAPARSSARRPNLRKLAELAYQQTRSGAWRELRATLEDLLFVRTKCNAGRTADLIGDYERALDALDAAADQADTTRALGEWRSFVVRERAAFEAHTAIDGFVLQQALNAGGVIASAWQALPRRERNQCALHVEMRTRAPAPLATLERHAKGVTDCGFDAVGNRLFTAGMDGKVLAWRARGWDLEDTIAELPGSADSVAVSADGRRVATACDDGRVRIHDLASRTALECEGAFERHPRRCRFVNGDRELLAVGYRGIRLYDAKTGRLLKQGLDDAIFNDCTPGPGSLVTLGDGDGGAIVFDLKAWKPREHVYLGDVVRVQGSALSADGKRLLATGGRFSPDDGRRPFGETAIWGIAGKVEEEIELERHASPAMNCMFVDSERALVVGLLDGTLCVHRSADGALIQRVRAHDNGLRGLALSPDGVLLATAAFDGKVRIWSVAGLLAGSGDDAGDGEGKRGLHCALDSSGRNGWALTATVDHPLARVRIQRFGAASGSQPHALPRSRRLDELPISRRDPGMPRQVFEIDIGGSGARAAHRGAPVSSDGPHAIIHSASRFGPSEFFFLPELAPERWSSDNMTWARSIDGRATALLRGSMVREAGALQRKFDLLWFVDDAHTKPYLAVKFTTPLDESVGPCQFSMRPHCVLLAVGNEVREFVVDGRTRLVGRADTKVTAYVEDDDSERILIGALDGSVSLWKLADATPLLSFSAHRGEVVDVVFLGADRFFTAGADGTVRLWRVLDGRCEAVHVADAALAAVDASPLGRRVMAVDAKGGVYWMRVLA